MIFWILGFFGLSAAFIRIWFVMQKRFNKAETRLAETFKALSFEMMERNSRTFLDLAHSTLSKYQESAKSDLESRHKGIEASILPFREAIKQLDEQQRELE